MNFPAKLTSLMRRDGFTQTSLGRKLELSQKAVSKWQAGKSRPGPETARRLADLFTLPVEVLLDDDQSLPTQSFQSQSQGGQTQSQSQGQEQAPPKAGLHDDVPPAAMAILTQAHVADCHYRDAVSVIDCFLAARPTFANEEKAEEFREMLRIFLAKRERGAAAVHAAVKALRLNANAEIYRAVLEQEIERRAQAAEKP